MTPRENKEWVSALTLSELSLLISQGQWEIVREWTDTDESRAKLTLQKQRDVIFEGQIAFTATGPNTVAALINVLSLALDAGQLETDCVTALRLERQTYERP